MLTSDLLRVRSWRGEMRPRYVDASDADLIALAEQLLEIFAEHVGRSRGELEEALRDVLGTGTDFLLHRGLAKLLFDRCVFETAGSIDPPVLREAVFAAAATAYRAEPTATHWSFDRSAVYEQASEHFGDELSSSPVSALERGLYADLKEEQELTEWRGWTPRELLDRYNVALAQGVILRAVEIELRVGRETPARHRALFQRLKFFQLMYRVEADGKGWILRLDGPLSIFQASGKYGVRMASFLPTLLHLKEWSLEAKLLWGKKRVPRTFKLGPEQELVPFGRLRGQWRPEELTWLPDQMAKLTSAWTISGKTELVNLGGEGILVPDYVFLHEDGVEVVMEVFGYWRKGAVASRLKLLRRHGPENLILALSSRLAAEQGEDLAALPGEVYVFRSAPVARQVLEILERMRQG